MTIWCPKCDADITDSWQDDEPDVGIVGGWYCEACDTGYGEHELGDVGHDDDVIVAPPARDPSQPIGIPISQLSGRPGHAGYDAWLRLCKSWGHE